MNDRPLVSCKPGHGFGARNWLRATIAALGMVAIFVGAARPLPSAGMAEDAAARDLEIRAAARVALREHTRWILERPAQAPRLFVEGYFERTLVAAHAVFASSADSALADSALACAFAFAETLATTQRSDGYWHLGYDAGWVADMAAALAVFVELEPYADSLQLVRYTRTAARFTAALERDRLVLPEGAVGVGWPLGSRPEGTQRAWRSDYGWSDDPYLVATSLAGIELQAWLFRQTDDAGHRDGALRALDWTLGQLRADGGLPDFTRPEGELTTAAYAEEGWMAAATLLPSDSLRLRLCRSLESHVDWLLGLQGSDGTWDGGVRGERARTPRIVEFLLWSREHCGDRADVRAAIDRSAPALIGFERIWARGLESDAEHLEVLRAMVGPPLAALATGGAVPRRHEDSRRRKP